MSPRSSSFSLRYTPNVTTHPLGFTEEMAAMMLFRLLAIILISAFVLGEDTPLAFFDLCSKTTYGTFAGDVSLLLQRKMSSAITFTLEHSKSHEMEQDLLYDMTYQQQLLVQSMYSLDRDDTLYLGLLSSLPSYGMDSDKLSVWLEETFVFTKEELVKYIANLARWSKSGSAQFPDLVRAMRGVFRGFNLSSEEFQSESKAVKDWLIDNGFESHTLGFVTPSLLEKIFSNGQVDGGQPPVKLQDSQGRTLLYVAIEKNDSSKIDLYLSSGADPNARVRLRGCDSSLLHTAAMRDQGFVITALVKYGADVHSVNCRNLTALHIAVEGNKASAIVAVVSSGFDIDRKYAGGDTLLSYAIDHSDEDTVSALLHLGAYPDVTNDREETPLLKALLNNKPSLARILRQNGAKINYIFRNGDTYLHKAVRYEDVHDLIYFLKSTMDVEALNEDGETPLAIAVKRDSAAVINALLNNGANINFKLKGGFTYLHIAVLNNSTSAVTALLDHGISSNENDAKGKTPIRLAIEKDNARIVEILAAAGADLKQKFGELNYTLIHLAVDNNSTGVLKKLLEGNNNPDVKDSAGKTPIVRAVEKNNAEMVSVLESAGSDLEQKFGRNNWTLLHLAVDRNSMAAMETLLRHGEEIDVKSSQGETPILLATRKDRAEVVSVLADAGADLRQKVGDSESTLLMEAAERGYTDVVNVLFNHGAQVDGPDREGRTPLHSAAAKGFPDVVSLLLSHNAPVDAMDVRRTTPLLLAAGNGHIEIIKLLLEHGAEVDAATVEGWTALHAAAKSGHTDAVRTLLYYGAKPELRDAEGNSALHLAATEGHAETITLLLQKKSRRSTGQKRTELAWDIDLRRKL